MSKKAKVFIGIVVLGVLGAAVAVNMRGDRTPTTDVEVEAIKARQIVSIVEASGQIEPSVSVDISSDVIGRIVELGADEGDRVRRGQFLIQIDPAQYEQRAFRAEAVMQSAAARLDQARANLERARLEFERKERLYHRELVPKADFDQAKADLDVNRANLTAAEFDVNQTEASLEETRDSLSKCRILAPMDGIVIRKNAEVGETAISGTLNNAGSLLMTIADLSSMETEVEVDETDVVNIRIGQEAGIELDAFPDKVFTGEVIRIANSSVQGSQSIGSTQSAANYKVTVRLTEMPDTIRPGLSATARITTSVREDVLGVPIQSLTIREIDEEEDAEPEEPEPGVALADSRPATVDSREVPLPEEGEEVANAVSTDADEEEPEDLDREGVFVIRDGIAVFVPVEVGIAGEKYFEVTGALQAGDEVVSGPFSALRNLKDGNAVKVKSEKDEDASDGNGKDSA